LLLVPTSASAAIGDVWDHGPGGERYVAIGDSAASGPVIPIQRTDPVSCLRSDHNFPTVAAETLAVMAFRDVTCSSATTAHMYTAQGDNIPQLDALGRDTTLVTLGPIGANDFNLVGVGIGCINPAPPGTGTSCKEGFEADGSDPNVETIRALRPVLAKIVRDVHKRAPRANVLVVGYGQYFTPGGCWPIVPLWPEDADYIQGLVDRLDAGLKRAARRNDATYVSLQQEDALDHTMCALPGAQWITQLVDPLNGLGVLAHPTALGMANFGRFVAEETEKRDERH
jgi:hypothetical protein